MLFAFCCQRRFLSPATASTKQIQIMLSIARYYFTVAVRLFTDARGAFYDAVAVTTQPYIMYKIDWVPTDCPTSKNQNAFWTHFSSLSF